MRIIEKAKHLEQYSITELDKGEVYRLPSGGTLYIKTGACDTPYNSVNLTNGVLGTVSEDFKGLLKVEGAFVENYKSDDAPDSINEQLAAKQAQCNQLWDTLQNLKNDYRNLERQLEDQERQLAERAMSIERLKADHAQLQNVCDDYQTRYTELEKAYKSTVNDSEDLFKQIIEAAYLGKMQGLEATILENPQRLVGKIRSLADKVEVVHRKDSEEENRLW